MFIHTSSDIQITPTHLVFINIKTVRDGRIVALPPRGVGEVSYLTSHATFNRDEPTTSNRVETGEQDMRFKQLFGLAALLAALLLFLSGTAGAQSIVTGAVGGTVT